MNRIKSRLCTFSLSDWGNVFTIVLGLASLITAYATIKALNTQNRIQIEVLDVQKQAEQPVFNINKTLLDCNGDGVYDTCVLDIDNEGGVANNVDVTVTTLFECEVFRHNLRNVWTYEVGGYYNLQYMPQNLCGLLFRAYSLNNYLCFLDLYNTAIAKSTSAAYYFISHVDLIHISYVDAKGKSQNTYYRDRVLIDEEEYKRGLSSITNRNKFLIVNTVAFDDLFQIDRDNE